MWTMDLLKTITIKVHQKMVENMDRTIIFD